MSQVAEVHVRDTIHDPQYSTVSSVLKTRVSRVLGLGTCFVRRNEEPFL